jgi:uncharacterized protein YfaS (alpha-2-macroglobulin family)
MTTVGPLDQAADTANSAVYAMSRVLDLTADGATAADAAAATYKLAAALDTMALMLGRIGTSQSAATSAETVAMAQCAAHVHKAADTAREAAAMTLNRHDTTEDTQ